MLRYVGLLTCLAGSAVALTSSARAQSVVYVNQAAITGNNDGTSWSNAYRGRLGLQAALTSLPSDAMAEIWVAQGTYTPGPPQVQLVTGRSLTFRIPNGVRVFGGFAGVEATLTERNPAAHETVLSGDLALNGNNTGLSTENTAHVVTMIDASSDTVLDGFTVSGGVAQSFGLGNVVDREHGAGLLIVGGAPRVRNCIFARNDAAWLGGGMCIDGSSDVTVENCLFVENTGRSFGAGASVVHSATARFSRCVFEANIGGSGIGIFSGLAITFNTGICRTVVEDCVFRANIGSIGGNSGGGILGRGGEVSIQRCLFDRNVGNGGGGVYFDAACIASVNASRFFANVAEGDLGDAAFSAGAAQAHFTNCAFWGHIRGAGSFADATPILANGGAIELTNCAIVNNGSTLTSPAAIVATGSTESSIALRNSIVWGNFGAGLTAGQAAARRLGNAGIRFDRCIVQGWTGTFPGVSNSGVDPRLISRLGVDGIAGTLDDDFHLPALSPCIDAGDSTLLSTAITVDLDTRTRRRDDPSTPDTGVGSPPIIDIGPYEFIPPCPADVTQDGTVSVGDLFEFLVLYFGHCVGQPAAPCQNRTADVDASGDLTVQDLFQYLAIYFAGCP